MALPTFMAFAAAAAFAATFSGGVVEVASNVPHPNGLFYDQLLLTGATATIQADPAQVTRISFLDMTDDIVQVEFSGAGRLTVVLHNATGPMIAAKYNQPKVLYVRGHASLTIFESDATTNVSVYSIGKVTAQNQAFLRDDVTYDGVADLALIQVVPNAESPNGATFGGIRAGNSHFSARSGDTGVYAPTVQMQGAVIVGDVSAFDSAIPKLWFGHASQFNTITIVGGDLSQPNGRAIRVHYLFSTAMVAGQTSAGVELPAQPLRGQFEPSLSGP